MKYYLSRWRAIFLWVNVFVHSFYVLVSAETPPHDPVRDVNYFSLNENWVGSLGDNYREIESLLNETELVFHWDEATLRRCAEPSQTTNASPCFRLKLKDIGYLVGYDQYKKKRVDAFLEATDKNREHVLGLLSFEAWLVADLALKSYLDPVKRKRFWIKRGLNVILFYQFGKSFVEKLIFDSKDSKRQQTRFEKERQAKLHTQSFADAVLTALENGELINKGSGNTKEVDRDKLYQIAQDIFSEILKPDESDLLFRASLRTEHPDLLAPAQNDFHATYTSSLLLKSYLADGPDSLSVNPTNSPIMPISLFDSPGYLGSLNSSWQIVPAGALLYKFHKEGNLLYKLEAVKQMSRVGRMFEMFRIYSLRTMPVLALLALPELRDERNTSSTDRWVALAASHTFLLGSIKLLQAYYTHSLKLQGYATDAASLRKIAANAEIWGKLYQKTPGALKNLLTLVQQSARIKKAGKTLKGMYELTNFSPAGIIKFLVIDAIGVGVASVILDQVNEWQRLGLYRDKITDAARNVSEHCRLESDSEPAKCANALEEYDLVFSEFRLKISLHKPFNYIGELLHDIRNREIQIEFKRKNLTRYVQFFNQRSLPQTESDTAKFTPFRLIVTEPVNEEYAAYVKNVVRTEMDDLESAMSLFDVPEGPSITWSATSNGYRIDASDVDSEILAFQPPPIEMHGFYDQRLVLRDIRNRIRNGCTTIKVEGKLYLTEALKICNSSTTVQPKDELHIAIQKELLRLHVVELIMTRIKELVQLQENTPALITDKYYLINNKSEELVSEICQGAKALTKNPSRSFSNAQQINDVIEQLKTDLKPDYEQTHYLQYKFIQGLLDRKTYRVDELTKNLTKMKATFFPIMKDLCKIDDFFG